MILAMVDYAYLGSDDFSLAVLAGLARERPPLLVVAQPDRPAGRKMRPKPCPVAAWAREQGIPLHQPGRFKEPEEWEPVLAARAAFLVLVSYGRILPRGFLEAAPPVLNAHPSLLPHLRGPSPMRSALLLGDTEGGVTVIRISPEVDAGLVLDVRRTAIGAEEDHGSLSTRLAAMSADMLLGVLRAGILPAGRPQEREGVSFCRKFHKDDCRLDPAGMDVATADRHVRAFHPGPGAFVLLAGPAGPVRLKILEARPRYDGGFAPGRLAREGDRLLIGFPGGSLVVGRVQAEGRSPVEAAAFLNGWRHPLALA